MCHQSIGLIARALEAAGIPTLSMTSAWSITEAVNPPRAAFVDYPVGHTTGQPHDPAGQRALLEAALGAFTETTEPGTIIDLGLSWGDDEWRANPLRGTSRTASAGSPSTNPKAASSAATSEAKGDSRGERFATPQYQTEADRAAAEARHGAEVACQACVGFDH